MHFSNLPGITPLLMLVSFASAQTWSVNASLPVPATAQFVSVWYQSVSQPAGPIAPGTIVTTTSYYAPSASASWLPSVPVQNAPLAFRLYATAHPSLSGGATLSWASVDAQLDLALTAPQPVAGRLALRFQPTGPGLRTLTLDVGADGSTEFVAPFASTGPAGFATVDLPLTIPVAGTVIRATLHAAGSLQYGQFPTSMNAVLDLQAEFFPGQPALHQFDTAGASATLATTHLPDNTATLALGSPTQPLPGWLVFGFQPTLASWSPTVTQLVTADSIIAVNSMSLLLPDLPPGTALFAQGLAILPGNVLATTDSVRCYLALADQMLASRIAPVGQLRSQAMSRVHS